MPAVRCRNGGRASSLQAGPEAAKEIEKTGSFLRWKELAMTRILAIAAPTKKRSQAPQRTTRVPRARAAHAGRVQLVFKRSARRLGGPSGRIRHSPDDRRRVSRCGRLCSIADAHTGLGEVQLESADVLDRCCVGRTREKRGETLAAADVPCLCVRTKLARSCPQSCAGATG